VKSADAWDQLRSRGSRVDGVPVWIAGLLVALLGWQVGMLPPGPGLDPSWNAGLAIAVHDGLRFGAEIAFSYGPLGFLQSQFVWFDGLAVLSFLYTGSVYVLFCIGLVWALARRLPLLLAVVLAFVLVAVMPLLEFSMLSAVFACFWLLERERSGRTLDLFVVGAATFGALAALIKLSTGPLVPLLLLIALIGVRAGRWRIAAFLGLLGVELLALWLVTGQDLGDVPAFVGHTLEISSGYSASMLRQTNVAAWKVVAATLAAVGVSLALVGAAWLAGYRDRAARWAGLVIVALASFAIYKEGVVRTDAGHLTLYFANACVLWLAVGLGGVRWRWMLAAAAVVAVMTVPVRPPELGTNLDFVANVRFAFDQARTLVSSGRREEASDAGRAGMQAVYRLEPGALAALRGRTVAVEPWEIGVVWAYGLDWRPLPVFQNYTAYTAALDRLNSEAVESPQGPERILRENQRLVLPEFPGLDLDGRFPGWDPPEQARAVLCNFAPLQTTERWQVLGRVADRCGPPRALGSVGAEAGEEVQVPAPRPGGVVFVRIDGAGVSGLERLQTVLFRARSRHLTVNGTRRYRLVPETAGDGLLLRASPGLVRPGPFSPIPEARSISVDGAPGDLTFSFFEIAVRPARR
jgi:hypothetical protein